MPLKEAALAVANEVSPVAAAVGAANTLVRRADGSWYADNTDVPGMVESLRAAGVTRAGSVAVLGAGGTARAALAAARELGPQTITVYARRPEAVEQLRSVRVGREGGRGSVRVGREGGRGSVRVGRDGGRESDPVPLTAAPWIDAARCGEADVVISTVPKGVADRLAVDWRSSTVLFDVLYDPWPTPLAASAQAAGCRIVSGLDLLLAQAVGQFEQFTGVPAPVAAMRAALEQARQ
jgi:shikimate dehydrogenase